MQIYHVEEKPHNRFVLDPDLGQVMRREMVMKASSVETIERGGKKYELRPDGTFEVDNETAQFLLSRPGWHEGDNPFYADVEIEPARPPKLSKAGARG
jgi:hypothetical protein